MKASRDIMSCRLATAVTLAGSSVGPVSVPSSLYPPCQRAFRRSPPFASRRDGEAIANLKANYRLLLLLSSAFSFALSPPPVMMVPKNEVLCPSKVTTETTVDN